MPLKRDEESSCHSGELSISRRENICRPASASKRRRILNEEQYVDTLTSVISRDYFPSLPSLRRDAAVLELRSAGDVAGAVAVRRAARRIEQHEESLASQAEEDERAGRKKALAASTLDEFHRRATSEDNAEFDRYQRVQDRERREKFERVFVCGANVNAHAIENGLVARESGASCAENGSGGDTPLLASDAFNIDQTTNEAAGSREKPRNPLFFTPQLPTPSNRGCDHRGGSALCERPQLIEGKGANSGDRQAQERRIMPPPAPVSNTPHREKSIQPSQTRFPFQNESRLPAAASTLADCGAKSTVSGALSSDTDTDLDATPISLVAARSARADRLAAENSEYVSMTPIIIPRSGSTDGQEGILNASPIVTWGNVLGTPLVIGGQRRGDNDDPMGAGLEDVSGDHAKHDGSVGPVFHISGENDRERAARAAEVRVNTKKTRKVKRTPLFPAAAGTASGTPLSSPLRSSTLSSSIKDRTSSLTPAAKSLLQKTVGQSAARAGMQGMTPSGAGVRSRSALRSALSQSYTPKVTAGRKSRRASTRRSVAVASAATPRRRRQDCSSQTVKEDELLVETHSGDITDGLLRLEQD